MPARVGLGLLLAHLGRTGKSLEVLKRGQEIDPTDVQIVKMMGHAHFVERNFDKALACYLASSKFQPSFDNPHYWMARAYLALTNYTAAIEQFEKRDLLGGSEPTETTQRYDELRRALLEGGISNYWRAALTQAQAQIDPKNEPYIFAQIYARLGEKDQSFEWLERAYESRNQLTYLIIDEFWDPWREEPRFKAVIAKIGLEGYEKRWRQRLSTHRAMEQQAEKVRR